MKKIIFAMTILLSGPLFGWKLGSYGEMAFKHYGENLYILHGPVEDPSVANEGFMNNPAFIEGRNGLIVIDPGGSYNIGRKVLAEIEKVSAKPILTVLNTHKHGDHWFANIAIREKYPNAAIYAHPQMIKEVKASEAEKWYRILDRLTHNLKGTKPFAFPDHALKEGQTITVDGETFHILHPSKAHTDTDILIAHQNSKTLFLGDNVMVGRLGAFDESSSILGNIGLLQELMKNDHNVRYVPGHGPTGDKNSTVGVYLHYLEVLADEAQKAYESDRESYEVKKSAADRLKAYKQWNAFSRQMGRHLDKVYREIEENDM